MSLRLGRLNKLLPALVSIVAVSLQPGFGGAADRPPLATIGDRPIYEEDLAPLIQPQLFQLRSQEYELKLNALGRLIADQLLSAEAARQGIPVAELLRREADSKVTEVSDAEVESYYLGRKDQLKRPLEELRPQLRQALMQARVQQARQEYVNRLRKAASVTIFLSPPRVAVSHDPARVRGAADAPITIVEFADFECPFCRQVHSTLKEVLARYDGRVKLAIRDFPLRNIHPRAQAAAEAARCAGEHGKFWEYHDALFAPPRACSTRSARPSLAPVGLDEQQFVTCLGSGKFKASIEMDLQEGVRAGVSGTPAFFINGRVLSGAQPVESFVRVSEDEVTRIRQ